MKNYLVTGGLSSLVESYHNKCYFYSCFCICSGGLGGGGGGGVGSTFATRNNPDQFFDNILANFIGIIILKYIEALFIPQA